MYSENSLAESGERCWLSERDKPAINFTVCIWKVTVHWIQITLLFQDSQSRDHIVVLFRLPGIDSYLKWLLTMCSWAGYLKDS